VVFAVSFASTLLANVGRVPNRNENRPVAKLPSWRIFAPADIEAGITAMADDV
jgi:hypothetical protein